MMRKGPSHALVTTSLIGSGGLLATSGVLVGTTGAVFGTLMATLGSAAAVVGSTVIGTIGALSVPSATLATPFFTTFLDLFSGASRGFWDASLGNDVFSEVFGGIACHFGVCGGAQTAAAVAPVAAPCPFC